MLSIKDLHVRVKGENKPILQGVNLNINPGEIHAIMGPNGSGKSTLSKTIAGHPQYIVTQGSVSYEVNRRKCDLLKMETYERARAGIFLAFQYPLELPGVNNLTFLQTAYNAQCKSYGLEEMDIFDFEKFAQDKMKSLKMSSNFLTRNVNVDFSGGEKKRNEIVQMSLFKPKLALLDETDSGLDVDSLKIVTDEINRLKTPKSSVMIITHYPRILEHLRPDFVHILNKGVIVKTGDHTLAQAIEKYGYDDREWK